MENLWLWGKNSPETWKQWENKTSNFLETSLLARGKSTIVKQNGAEFTWDSIGLETGMVLLRYQAEDKERKLEKAQGQSLLSLEGNYSVFELYRTSYRKPCQLRVRSLKWSDKGFKRITWASPDLSVRRWRIEVRRPVRKVV